MATHSAPRAPQGTGEHVLAAPASGAEGARRVLAVLQAFSPQQHTLTARELAELTAIPLPSMYRYIALLRDTGLLIGDDHGAYHLSPRFISLARAAEAAETLIDVADPVCASGPRVRRDGDLCQADRPGAGLRSPGGVGAPPARDVRAGPVAAAPAGRERAGAARGPDRAAAARAARATGETDPPAAVRLEQEIAKVAARGWATSEEEIDRGVWAAAAAVTDGRSTVAALTVPSPLVRAPSAQQERLLGQVRTAAARLSRLIENARLSARKPIEHEPGPKPCGDSGNLSGTHNSPGDFLKHFQSLSRLLDCYSTVILPACQISRVRPN